MMKPGAEANSENVLGALETVATAGTVPTAGFKTLREVWMRVIRSPFAVILRGAKNLGIFAQGKLREGFPSWLFKAIRGCFTPFSMTMAGFSAPC
jgi:hypothetical protein